MAKQQSNFIEKESARAWRQRKWQERQDNDDGDGMNYIIKWQRQ